MHQARRGSAGGPEASGTDERGRRETRGKGEKRDEEAPKAGVILQGGGLGGGYLVSSRKRQKLDCLCVILEV